MTLYLDGEGWIILFYGDQEVTGNTNTSTTIDNMSEADAAKCKAGSRITGTDIPDDTYITAVSTTSITISQAATGTTASVTLTIDNAITLHCEDWEYSKDDPSAISIDYADRGHFGLTLNAEKVVVKLKNVWVDTYANWNTLKAQLEAAEEAGDCALTIQVGGNTTPVYELFSGTANEDSMPVIIKSKKGYKKVYRGEATFYMIKTITMIQRGALA